MDESSRRLEPIVLLATLLVIPVIVVEQFSARRVVAHDRRRHKPKAKKKEKSAGPRTQPQLPALRRKKMGLPVSLLLIAVGAILVWAVSATTSGVNLHTVGWILLIVGIAGAVLSMVFWSSWAGPGSLGRRRTVVDEGGPTRRRTTIDEE
jgi:small-conductance mechanosensitive channel